MHPDTSVGGLTTASLSYRHRSRSHAELPYLRWFAKYHRDSRKGIYRIILGNAHTAHFTPDKKKTQAPSPSMREVLARQAT